MFKRKGKKLIQMKPFQNNYNNMANKLQKRKKLLNSKSQFKINKIFLNKKANRVKINKKRVKKKNNLTNSNSSKQNKLLIKINPFRIKKILINVKIAEKICSKKEILFIKREKFQINALLFLLRQIQNGWKLLKKMK